MAYNPPLKYFHEIDSLRALAVVAVIINHIHKSWLRGGFLGVDVFFVISGFVVTSALLHSESTSAKDFFVTFYKKRLKRLYPALLVCLCVFFFITFIIYPEPQNVLTTGFWATLGASNIQLVGAAQDYFGTSSEMNPFTHTWSLGVEEQFYFIYPFLFYFFVKKLKRGMIPALSLLLGASIISFLYFKKIDASWAFYLMPSRFWQLGLGGLIFLLPQTSCFKNFNKHWLLLPLGVLLFCLIASSDFSLGYSILATLSTAFILIFIKETETRSYLLLKPILTTGLLSYSLYLYHWPILVLVKNSISIEYPIVFIFTLILMTSLAWASFKFIENRLRRINLSYLKTASIASLIAFLWLGLNFSAIISEFIFIGNEPPGFLRQAKCYYNTNAHIELGPDFSYFFQKNFLSKCLPNKAAGQQKSIYFYGNSHALEKLPAIFHYANTNDYQLYFMGISGRHAFSSTPLSLCKDRLSLFDCFISTLKKSSSAGDLIIISTPIRSFMNKPSWLESFQVNLEKITRNFSNKGVTVYLISGYPDFKKPLNTALCNQPWSPYNPNCDLKKTLDTDAIKKTKKIDHIFRMNKLINYISLWDDVENIFLKQKHPYRFFYDQSHLSIEGAMALYPTIEKVLNQQRISEVSHTIGAASKP